MIAGTSPEPAERALSSLSHAWSDASSKLQGEQATLAQLTADQTDLFTAALKRYTSAGKPLIDGTVVNPATLKSKDQLEQRRRALREFLSANAELRSTLLGAEAHLRSEMKRRGVSPAHAEDYIRGFLSKTTLALPLARQIRDLDDEMGQTALQALDLLESQWGRWRYDTSQQALRFQSKSASEQFNAMMSRLTQIAAEQQKLQKTLVGQM